MALEAKYGRGDARYGGAEEDGMDDGDADIRLSQNQARMLFLLSLYPRWLKDSSFMVLVYEAVVAQVLDYDYAPASVMVNGKRMYFNVSQEAKSDLDFLREEELVDGLKISTTSHLPTTMYKVSDKGRRVLDAVSDFDRNAVYRVAHSSSGALLEVSMTSDDEFELVATVDGKRAFVRPSTVLAIEEVSYCSSAYIPACLRQGGRPTLSNAHRVEEVTRAHTTSIRDDLEEVLSLNSVSVIVAEWIPFGPSQMVELNVTLGSPERVLGGFFTAAIRDADVGSSLDMAPGLTAIQILDYDLAGHVNLEADIRFQEPEGIVQIETFGVSLHSSGSCLFGLQLEAVMDRVKDAISLDHLSRLLVDVQTDSSEVVEPLLSPAQRRMLDLAYRGHAASRNKVNLIVANEMTPHLTAEEYLDRDVYENEIRQVIGDTRAAYDITDQDTLIFGSGGLLLAGPNSRTYEPLLAAYTQLLSLDLFSQNMFSVIHVVRDDVRATASQCRAARRDPLALRDAVARIPSLHRTVIQIDKIVAFMEEALLSMELPEAPMTAAGRALYDRLACPDMQADMARRVTDLSKFLKELREELGVLEHLSGFVLQEADRDTSRNVALHTHRLLQAQHDPRVTRAAQSLETLQYLLMALVVYATMDRLVGQWSVAQTDWFRDAYKALFTRGGSAWLWISLLFACGTVAIAWWRYQRWWKSIEEDVLRVVLEVRRRISVPQLHSFLVPRHVLRSEWAVGPEGDEVTVIWEEQKDVLETWSGVAPVITAVYSAQLARMIRVEVEYKRGLTLQGKQRLGEHELRTKLDQLFAEEKIYRPDASAPVLLMATAKESTQSAQAVVIAGQYAKDEIEEDMGGGGFGHAAPGAQAEARKRQMQAAPDRDGAAAVAVAVPGDAAAAAAGGGRVRPDHGAADEHHDGEYAGDDEGDGEVVVQFDARAAAQGMSAAEADARSRVPPAAVSTSDITLARAPSHPRMDAPPAAAPTRAPSAPRFDDLQAHRHHDDEKEDDA